MSTPASSKYDPTRNAQLQRYATYAAVATAVVLIAAKLVAALLTGSVSILASLVDSMMDALASTVNLLAVHYALLPPDEEHRFGHGKAEPLAGLLQAGFISGSALFLILHAVDRLVHPQAIQAGGLGIAVITFSILATALLLPFQYYVIRRTHSTAIRADALHYATDVLSNTATLVGLALAMIGWQLADPIIAIGIAVFILHSAIKLALDAVQLLMDRELPEDVHNRIMEIACIHPQVGDIHGLRTRRSGQTYFIQLHLAMDDSLPLAEAHEVADEVEQSIMVEFPNADVIIHLDPISDVRAYPYDPGCSTVTGR